MNVPADAYRSTGVDLQAADKLKQRIQGMAATTYGPQVLSGIGGFAGLYRLDGFSRPILVASTDGVGTKLRVASLMGRYESLGVDLVNLNVNDVITYGAKPLFFLDYLSTVVQPNPEVGGRWLGKEWMSQAWSRPLL